MLHMIYFSMWFLQKLPWKSPVLLFQISVSQVLNCVLWGLMQKPSDESQQVRQKVCPHNQQVPAGETKTSLSALGKTNTLPTGSTIVNCWWNSTANTSSTLRHKINSENRHPGGGGGEEKALSSHEFARKAKRKDIQIVWAREDRHPPAPFSKWVKPL